MGSGSNQYGTAKSKSIPRPSVLAQTTMVGPASLFDQVVIFMSWQVYKKGTFTFHGIRNPNHDR
jgi:hypothetical protein